MSPIDAVRNGQTGERFRKKSIMSLGRSKLPATPFLALNDIVSSPKRFGIITFAFFLCLSLLLILSTTVSTMKGGTFGGALALADFDISAKCKAMEFMTEDGHEKLKANIGDTITIKTIDGDKEFIITALFQSMSYMGEGVRFHEDEEINYIQAQGAIFTLIKFTDAPDQTEIARRIGKIQELRRVCLDRQKLCVRHFHKFGSVFFITKNQN